MLVAASSLWHLIDYVQGAVVLASFNVTLPSQYRMSITEMGWITGMQTPMLASSLATMTRSVRLSTGSSASFPQGEHSYPLNWIANDMQIDAQNVCFYVVLLNCFVLIFAFAGIVVWRVSLLLATSLLGPRPLATKIRQYHMSLVPLSSALLEWAFRIELFFFQPVLLSCGLHVQYTDDSIGVQTLCYFMIINMSTMFIAFVYYSIAHNGSHAALVPALITDYRDGASYFLVVKVVCKGLDALLTCLLTRYPVTQVYTSFGVRMVYALLFSWYRPMREKVDTYVGVPIVWANCANVMVISLFLETSSSNGKLEEIATDAIIVHIIIIITLLVIRSVYAVWSLNVWIRSIQIERFAKEPSKPMHMATMPVGGHNTTGTRAQIMPTIQTATTMQTHATMTQFSNATLYQPVGATYGEPPTLPKTHKSFN